MAETSELAYIGRNEEGEWGLAQFHDRYYWDELHPIVHCDWPIYLVCLTATYGLGSTEAGGDDLSLSGNYIKVQGYRGVKLGSLLG